MRHQLLVGYRAYDIAMEMGMFGERMVDQGVGPGGKGYDEVEFSLEWPVKTDRFAVGEYPKQVYTVIDTPTDNVDAEIYKDYLKSGERLVSSKKLYYDGVTQGNLKSSGMVATVWKDTSCCLKTCCEFYPFMPAFRSVTHIRSPQIPANGVYLELDIGWTGMVYEPGTLVHVEQIK